MQSVIGALATFAAKRWPDAPALMFPELRRLTFKDVDDLAGRFAGGLAKAGIGRGDRVVLHLANCWQWIIAYHAIARLGAVVVPANILLSAPEVSFMIANAGARAAIVPAGGFAFGDARPSLIVSLDGAGVSMPFSALLDGDWLPSAALSPDDLFTIGYTSGTTGKPKGAALTQGNIFSSTSLTATIHVRTANDRIYSALPFPHVYGNVVMNACFLTGATLVVPVRFDPAQALRDIAAERITLFEGVPTMYYQMLASAEIADADLTTLSRCTVGGQTMPLAKIEAAATRFGCPMLELWGMTEVAGPATSHSPYWPPRYGSIGLPFPGVQIRVVELDDAKVDKPAGEVGT